MTDKVKKRLALLLDKKYRLSRSDSTSNYTDALNGCKSLSERAGKLFAYTLGEEKPLFHGDDDDFGFNRYNGKLCEDESKIGHMYQFGNIIIDYATYLKKGLRGIRYTSTPSLVCSPQQTTETLSPAAKSSLMTLSTHTPFADRVGGSSSNKNKKCFIFSSLLKILRYRF